jgi:hypothetical protein
MLWSQTSPVDQNTPCIADDLRDRLAVTEPCALYGVSCQTGYTWSDRYLTHGPQGVEARSHRPSTSPGHTPDHAAMERSGMAVRVPRFVMPFTPQCG